MNIKSIKIMKNLVLILALLFLVSCKKKRQETGTDAALQVENMEYNWIRSKVNSVMKKNNIPAISIGLVRNGKLEFAEGFGVKNRKTKTLVDKYSLYQIGSDTKKMTGIIVRNLVAQGKLDLNTSIVTYLPPTLTDDAKEKLKPITVLNLLHHKSGIPNRAPSNKRIDGDPMLIPYTEKNLHHDLNTIQLDFEPGTKFSYSNLGYGIIGYICERVSKQPYAQLIEQYIATPYHLPNTTTVPSEKQLKKLVTPYRKDARDIETKRYIMGKLTPAGGVYSNVMDISELMIHQINAYNSYTTTGDVSNPLVLTENSGIEGNDYGFGLGKRVFETGVQYGHGGDMDGFGSAYIFSPEYNLGLIILTSSGGRWIGELEKELFFKFTKRIYTAPKESIVEAFAKQISDYGLDKAMIWFNQHKNSNDYILIENEMNNLGYSFLGRNKKSEAIAIFQLNVSAFPSSANTYDSLAEAYMHNNENELAIKNYTKSLTLNPQNKNAAAMLTKLRVK